MAIDPKRVQEVFLATVLQSDSIARAAILDRECAGDDALRQRVEALLRAHEAPGSRMDHPAAAAVVTAPHLEAINDVQPETPGTQVGPYRLLQELGHGGMGSVFMAQQDEPVQRRVALKIVKAGMDTAHVLARFEMERQALALMDHPNIAKVFDAGKTPEGRPYFAMELIRGIPITRFCDQEHLSPRERLELMIPVCEAVQHAHQKGIIHRDLKPSNILIALYDGKPIPKVIDFGVAKATGPRLTEHTMFTQFGQVVGTLEYMAPEQAELNNLDIDTRADIYSLGVVLYELLAGTPPFTSEQLRGAAFDEMLRMIREVEPPKPSTKLSSSDDLPSIAANRKLEPKRLTKLVHGELDWIAMKCLEKDRGRRYKSASSLARDIERFIAQEPVLAGPHSRTYQLRKFIRRNKGPVIASSLVLLALVAGITGISWGLVEAHRQRDEAKAREAETRAVLDFVENRVFAAARPQGKEGGLGSAVTLRQAVETALPFVEGSFANHPLIQARLRMTLGKSFSLLGDANTATEQYLATRSLYAQHRGPDHPDTLYAMNGLANCYYDLGRLDEALKLHEETLALCNAKLAPDHQVTLWTMNNLARDYLDLGRREEALKLNEKTMALYKVKLGPAAADTLMSMGNLAISYSSVGRLTEALQLAEAALELRKAKFGPEHPDTLESMISVGVRYSELGRYVEAMKLREATLAVCKSKLGHDHLWTLGSMGNLAVSYGHVGRHADSLKLNEEALALMKAKLGSDHPNTLMGMQNVAVCFYRLGRNTEALRLWEETLAQMTTKLGRDHPLALKCMNNLAVIYGEQNRQADAQRLCEEALAVRKAKLGHDHPETLSSMQNLAHIYLKSERLAEGLTLIEETLALLKSKLGPHHPDTLRGVFNLASAYANAGRQAEAETLHSATLEMRKAKLGPHHPDTLKSMSALATLCNLNGRYEEAIKRYEEALALRKAHLGREHPDTMSNIKSLADNYAKLNRHEEAVKLYHETLELREANLGADHPDTHRTRHNLANTYYRLRRHNEALKLHEVNFTLTKARFGADHPDTLMTMCGLADSLVRCHRGDEAISVIDDFVKLAAGKPVNQRMFPDLINLRLRHFQNAKDAAGCRVTAEIWEGLNRRNAKDLYVAACNRAVTASVLMATGASDADAEAELAMLWLKQAVAAGYKDAEHLKKDKDLSSLREREDFKALVAELE